MASTAEIEADVVIVGGGHNGLVAAAYLAAAGRSVVVLERRAELGGAAVSERVFPGVDARLSRYSYLVSLLPDRIVDDLGLRIALRRRRYSSYTPLPGTDTGLLIDTADATATAASFAAIGAAADAEAFVAWQADLVALAEAVWPTLTGPLPRAADVRGAVGERLWADFFARPIGETIRARFASDLVRGVVATDALIGTFTSIDDPSLAGNACLLYHVIGRGTGDWDVPVGGMGAVSAELVRAATEAGADLRTGTTVIAIDAESGRVRAAGPDGAMTVRAGVVLANVAPAILDGLVGAPEGDRPEGAQIKANMLLTRLPRLRDGAVDAGAAFAGTFHVHELATDLETAVETATGGAVPDPLPLEVYCHSLSDPSILGAELQAAGVQTLTAFGLHTPHRLGLDRATARRAVLASLDSVLAEPIEPLLVRDAAGRACMEVRTTSDLEDDLAMPGGNIFHGPLTMPFAEDDEPLVTCADRWGVATTHPRVLLCGAGSRRGGGVSGLGGLHAALALLES